MHPVDGAVHKAYCVFIVCLLMHKQNGLFASQADWPSLSAILDI